MGYIIKICAAIFVVFVAKVYFSLKPYFDIPTVPKLEEKWWGLGKPTVGDGEIVPFRINVSEETLNDLNRRLENHIPFQEPLEGVQHHYGFNTHFLKTVVDFWHKKYSWIEREDFMNKYPQFKVKIQGLNIHYLHIKPTNATGLKVLPMLMLHGWPSSVREFYEIVPFLINRREDRDFVFELIIPSVPGFGFSDASHRPGLSAVHISIIFKNFMKRLGFEKYYLQGGGGIGGAITQYLAILYPENVIGVHSNFCFVDTPLSIVKLMIASIYPPLFVNKNIEDKVFPLLKIWSEKILESGHLHIQSTKPDTIGVGLRDSPVGLAAYILEKFITWSNSDWKDLDDGGLHLKYLLTDLLDNIMVYWVTGSITTSMRIYAEHFHQDTWKLGMDRIPISEVPSGCMRFWHDVNVLPDFILREKYSKLIHISDYETGHFAALEVPALLSEDIFQFVDEVEKTLKVT